MADILSLDDARQAIRAITGDVANDADLETIYVPATTPIVEDLVGPVMAQSGREKTADGGVASVLLPVALISVESVTESGTVLTEDSDYTVNLAAGIVSRGSGSSTLPSSTFKAGLQNVVISYTAGANADNTTVAPRYKLGARIILAHLWQADNGGYRPAFGQPDDEIVMTPSGFAVPRRAVEVLAGPGDFPMPGFA